MRPYGAGGEPPFGEGAFGLGYPVLDGFHGSGARPPR